MASRCITFDCPACRLKHVGDRAWRRQLTCDVSGREVYFADEWEPTLDPALRGTPASDLPSFLFWCVAFILMLCAALAGA